MRSNFKFGITMGDPMGCGPEVLAKTWGTLDDDARERLVVYGDSEALARAAKLAGIEFDAKRLVITSKGNEDAAQKALLAMNAAASDALSGNISALVTAPVNKKRMSEVVQNFTGHTEYLAKKAGVKETVMMFYLPLERPFCISLVTSHIPLKDVPKAVTKDRICAVARLTSEFVTRHLGTKAPRIAVMSLNPHGGEDGLMGMEEADVIAPAVEELRTGGINCFGPVAGDALFRDMQNFEYDAVIAMSHDQGLIPAKFLCPQRCVNVTLGLPFVRTSPGHGTAEDIAWQGKADESGMLEAIRLAMRLS